MKRFSLSLEDVADWHNLATATYRAAKGKRNREEVQAFLADLSGELTLLRREVLDGAIVLGRARRFRIRDPKIRVIHAPCFRERVLHHALMAHVGPVLDRALISDTYACRVGKGTLAAVHRCQHHARRFPWYAKIDVRGYFPSIEHRVLKTLLRQKIKGAGVLHLIDRVIDAHHDSPGRGLPIGALTSQHFANFYLNGFDRFLLETCRVAGMVRYMDDVAWWCRDRDQTRDVLHRAEAYLRDELGLVMKTPVQRNRSARGVTMCGYRVFPGTIRLSLRRRRLYAAARLRWERAYVDGRIDEATLQAGYSSALAITLHADATAWRREQLRRSRSLTL